MDPFDPQGQPGRIGTMTAADEQADQGDANEMESQSQPTGIVDESDPTLLTGLAPTETTFGQLIPEPPQAMRDKHRIDGVIVWTIASVAFFGYLEFGSLSVQVWRFSDFLQQYYPIHVTRRIRHIWIYQGEQLPNVRLQWLLFVAYYASLAVCVAGAIYGLWLLLDRVGTGASTKPATQRPPQIEG